MNDKQKHEYGLKLFLLAWAYMPETEPMFGAFSKKEIRAFRAKVLELCQEQRNTNPIATIFLRGMSSQSLTDLSNVMLSVRKLYQDLEAEYGPLVTKESVEQIVPERNES